MILLFSAASVALPVLPARRDSRRLAQQASRSRCSKGCRFCLREEIHGGGRRSRLAHPYTKYSQLPDAFTLRYEAYPADIPDNAPDETEFDLPDEAVLAVIFFAAAQTQSMEYDQRFFQSFYAQYQGKLSNLSGQADGPAAVVTGGCNV